MKNPILRILFGGVLLALLYFVVRGSPVKEADRRLVVISDADVENVRARWIRLWGRGPTEDELRRALEQYVRDEILYREALARGLDREDPTVRLAMVRKMQMMAGAQVDAREFSDADVEAFFALSKERYRIPATLSIAHVLFRAEDDPASAQARAEMQLAALREKDVALEEVNELGDPSLLKSVQRDLSAPELERLFGPDFAAEVLSLPEGSWEGPVASPYGIHLVKILSRTPSRLPDLADVRSTVLQDLQYEERKAAEDQAYQEVASGYRVRFTENAARLQGNPSP